MLGEIADRMAHEIKNPLTSIYSGLQLLKMQTDLGGRERERLDLILSEARRINDIMKNLVAFSKPPVLNLAMGGILDPIESALTLLAPQLKQKDIPCKRAYEKTIEKCLMDGYQMRQVFFNLFINAVQAMDRGGELSTHVRCRKIRHRDIIEIEITDTGCGIPPEQLRRVFTPFFSTKPRGAGLGLVTAKRVVEAHGGVITAFSEPGKGASFVLRLFAGRRRKCWEIKGCSTRDHCNVFELDEGLRCWAVRDDDTEVSLFDIDQCSSCEVYEENSLHYYLDLKGDPREV
jgi:two-component system sensor histidine kinase HydH